MAVASHCELESGGDNHMEGTEARRYITLGWEMNCRFCSLLDCLEQKVTQQVQLRVVRREPTTSRNLVPRVLFSYPRENLGTRLTVVNFFGRIKITTAFIWLYVLVRSLLHNSNNTRALTRLKMFNSYFATSILVPFKRESLPTGCR